MADKQGARNPLMCAKCGALEIGAVKSPHTKMRLFSWEKFKVKRLQKCILVRTASSKTASALVCN